MRRLIVLLLVLGCLGLSACSLPRVAVLRDPLTAQEHLQLGLAYEHDGELELAREHYKDAADELPEAHYYLGNLAFGREEWGKAEREYKRAITGLPGDPRPRNNLAWLYFTRKINLEQAEELAQQALSLASEAEKGEYMDTLELIRQARNAEAES
jgi:tetratricopeptide (TPR) repeat protein